MSAYRSVIKATGDELTVPLFFPHVVLGSAHLMILGHEKFPLGALGLLHLRNQVVRFRAWKVTQPWDVSCELSRQRYVEKGLEFDFDSTVTVGGEIVWRSVSTYLKRGRPLGEVIDAPDVFPAVGDDVETASFNVPHDIGKRYAKVSGDYNPIHVSSLAAKLFGFKRAIAHGMWSVARAVQELPAIHGPEQHDVAFKGPMFVSSQATVQSNANGRFDIFCGSNPRPVIVGTYREATNQDEFVREQ